MTTADLEAYQTGIAAPDLEGWPVGFGAPFYRDLDGDGQQGPNEPTVSLDLEDVGYGVKRLDLEAGGRHVMDVGILFAQGSDRLQSVAAVRVLSDLAQAAYAAGRLTRTGPPPGPPPTVAPTLLSPADGAAFEDADVTFEWEAIPGQSTYQLELSLTEGFEAPETFQIFGTQQTVSVGAFEIGRAEPYYWRVRALGGSGVGPPSETRTFTNDVPPAPPELFASFEVVANAAGPLSPSTGGAADFAGFPVPERPDARQQATTGVR